MSGFEIAGLALAIIPIVYGALKDVYETHVGKITGVFMNAKRERRKFAGQLLSLDTALRSAMLDIFNSVGFSLTEAQWSVIENDGTVGTEFVHVWNEIIVANSGRIRTILRDVLDEVDEVLNRTAQILIEIVVHTKIVHPEKRGLLRSILQTDNSVHSISFYRPVKICALVL